MFSIESKKYFLEHEPGLHITFPFHTIDEKDSLTIVYGRK